MSEDIVVEEYKTEFVFDFKTGVGTHREWDHGVLVLEESTDESNDE